MNQVPLRVRSHRVVERNFRIGFRLTAPELSNEPECRAKLRAPRTQAGEPLIERDHFDAACAHFGRIDADGPRSGRRTAANVADHMPDPSGTRIDRTCRAAEDLECGRIRLGVEYDL